MYAIRSYYVFTDQRMYLAIPNIQTSIIQRVNAGKIFLYLFHLEQDVGHDVPPISLLPRITSYNVCYTKLLRAFHQRANHMRARLAVVQSEIDTLRVASYNFV